MKVGSKAVTNQRDFQGLANLFKYSSQYRDGKTVVARFNSQDKPRFRRFYAGPDLFSNIARAIKHCDHTGFYRLAFTVGDPRRHYVLTIDKKHGYNICYKEEQSINAILKFVPAVMLPDAELSHFYRTLQDKHFFHWMLPNGEVNDRSHSHTASF